ncbi:acyl-CoA thioesterase [Sinimarinibacterium sp. CAU 1509]|uniref:acyl-CoA thioesterase n=1 Tax=Sinimarinibacterium sp. CAU 1509 TaxID=2562283 RepID=UPI00146CC673|nr:thioesterase family protein [Sinimarinibacterium sp. CAU 1509]
MNPPASADDFGYFFDIATRWSDLDSLGHVNNARFFTFDESARLDYFGELMHGDPEFWQSKGFILAHIGCDFIAQLHHPARLRIGFRISRLGRSSMDTQSAMFDGERLVAVTRGVLVWFNYREQKTAPIPDDVRALIRAREKIPPDEG